MLAFILFAVLQGNIFLSAGIGAGTSFTDTSINIAPSVSVHAFPFSLKNIGIFNTFDWKNYHFDSAPFNVDVKDKVFVVGPAFRIIYSKIQPSFKIGFMHFKENIDVAFNNQIFIREKDIKNTLFFGTGAYMKVWKKVYLDPEISFALSGRPPWKITVRAGWFF